MKHSQELREESPATNQLRSSRKNYGGCMGLPSDIFSDRDSRFIPHLWQRTDESPRYQAIDVDRFPPTSRRPNRADKRHSRAIPTPLLRVSTRRLGRTSPLAEHAYNTAISDTTNTSPFFANYGYQPETQRIRPAASEANFTNPASELHLAPWES
jgi:hypothetical protein